MKTDILTGDCRQTLKTLPDQSAHCCVTSPPYFGLRSYCEEGSEQKQYEIGLEQTPEDFVNQMVEVFREVKRVLRNDGTLWLNLGDSYGAVGGNTYAGFNKRWSGTGGAGSKQDATLAGVTCRKINAGVKPKNLLGIPWRVAFALQADGWYLRQDIIWHKPNPMPESVQDRCTKAHEYIFLLSKSQKYFYDRESVRLDPKPNNKAAQGKPHWFPKAGPDRINGTKSQNITQYTEVKGANLRSVWTVTPKPYKEAHFATYPPELITRCILAGCPKGGTVLDPFGGSGTTAQAAMEHGRNAILCELNPEYVKLINHRLAQVQPSLI